MTRTSAATPQPDRPEGMGDGGADRASRPGDGGRRDAPRGPIRCPACRLRLALHQPDPNWPTRLLGTCAGCRTWVIIDHLPGQGRVLNSVPPPGEGDGPRNGPAPGRSDGSRPS
ncbi:hypothetical protein TA3x_000173 [Tundrisphaera sp. TA3]|uniref:hypothetical protein n=1 Tax=Tundrisphaera sp. TA3 TaxID=3435775 RepID=UPI003EB9159C